MAAMTLDQLHAALSRDGHEIADDLFERAVDALAGPLDADGMPALDFLPARLQVAVLAAMYRDFLEGAPDLQERLIL